MVGCVELRTSATSSPTVVATSNVTATLPAVISMIIMSDSSTPRAAAISLTKSVSKVTLAAEPAAILSMSTARVTWNRGSTATFPELLGADCGGGGGNAKLV